MAADIDAPVTHVASAPELETDHDAEAENDSLSTIGHCKRCGSEVGEFLNSWIKGTGSYYLPSMAGSFRLSKVRTGKPSLAKGTSSLGECTIEALKCDNNNCGDNVGFHCVKAPENKRVFLNQHMFKLTRIQLMSETTGQPVEPIIEDGRALHKEPSLTGRTSMDPTEDTAGASDVLVQVRNPSAGAAPSVAPSHLGGTAGGLHKSANGPSAPAQSNGFSSQGALPDYLKVIIDARLEPVDRLQAQISSNRATLEVHTRQVQSLGESFVAMQNEMRRMSDLMEVLRRELYSRTAAAGPRVAQELPDQALETLSTQVQHALRKANEVDELKVQMELLKRKVNRASESSPATGSQYPSLPQLAPPAVPHLTMPRAPQPQLQPQPQAQLTPYTPGYSSEVSPTTAWTSVNTNVKRAYSNGVEEPTRAPAGGTIQSPKRLKLAAPESQCPPQLSGTPDVPAQLISHDSHPDSTTSSTFQPHTNPQRQEWDDNWRREPHPLGSNSSPDTRGASRGRPRGRAGGRPRKSLPLETHNVTTTEWERREPWGSAQVAPDGFYQPASPAASNRGSTLRRGSGGASSANRVPIPPPAGPTVSPINVLDSYAHTKKTRTKPIRNADGVLIRKDGRPDMRSQSSAANLRKVHARKEEERRLESGTGRAPGTEDSMESSPMTPASLHSTGHLNGEEEMENAPNTQERTEKILQRMFPHGIEEQRGKLANAEMYFPSSGKNTPDGPVVRDESAGEGVDQIEHKQQEEQDEEVERTAQPR